MAIGAGWITSDLRPQGETLKWPALAGSRSPRRTTQYAGLSGSSRRAGQLLDTIWVKDQKIEGGRRIFESERATSPCSAAALVKRMRARSWGAKQLSDTRRRGSAPAGDFSAYRARSRVGDSRGYVDARSMSPSILAARIKSFSCRPLIFFVCSE